MSFAGTRITDTFNRAYNREYLLNQDQNLVGDTDQSDQNVRSDAQIVHIFQTGLPDFFA